MLNCLLSIAVGVALGFLSGIALHSVVLGVAIGVALGFMLCVAMTRLRRRSAT